MIGARNHLRGPLSTGIVKFTMAASGATAPGQCIFKNRDTKNFMPIEMLVKLGPQGTHKVFCFHGRWSDIRERSPFNRRGWAVQERLLSPRTMHVATPVT